MIGRVVKEVGVANVSDFDQRSKISAETSRDGPAVLYPFGLKKMTAKQRVCQQTGGMLKDVRNAVELEEL